MPRYFLTAICLTTLAACDDTTTQDTSTQLANPAATFCAENGHTYEIRDGAGGQTGVCILSDGSEVDAWDYFRKNNAG